MNQQTGIMLVTFFRERNILRVIVPEIAKMHIFSHYAVTIRKNLLKLEIYVIQHTAMITVNFILVSSIF